MFVKYRGQRNIKPLTSLSKNNGLIRINRTAVKTLVDQEADHVQLYFDREGNRIGIEGTKERTKSTRKLISTGCGSRSISGKGFCNTFGITLEQSMRGKPTVEDGMIIFELK